MLPNQQLTSSVDRSNLLDAIDDQLAAGTAVLSIQGQAGEGKSHLAHAYWKRHHQHSILVQVSAASSFAYDPDHIIAILCDESRRILSAPPNPPISSYSRSDLSPLYSKLSRIGSSRTPVTIIVDGLHAIPHEDRHILQHILDLLPFGLPGIRIVFTDLDPPRIPKTSTSKWHPWRIPRFTQNETRQFLAPLLTDQSATEVLHRLVSGRPASLEIAARLVSGGTLTVEQLAADQTGDIKTLLEYEWSLMQPVDDTELLILGLVTLARNPVTLSEACRVLKVQESAAAASLARFRFLKTIKPHDTIAVDSDYMHAFIKDKTSHLHPSIYAALIEDLMQRPDSREGVTSIPRYLRESGQLPALLQYLSPSRVEQTLASSETTSTITLMLAEGLNAANRLQRDGDCYRFALQRSTVAEIERASTWEANIDALLALGQMDKAILLAESVPLASDRLMLLSRIAGKAPTATHPEHLVGRVQRLLDDVASQLGPEECVDLAGHLLGVLPDRALGLLRQSASSAKPGANVDWAIAIVALRSRLRDRETGQTANTQSGIESQVASTIRDPDVERLTNVMILSLGTLSAEEAIARAGSIDRTTDQLFFMSTWITGNHKRADAIQATDWWLRKSIATTEHLPNARDVLTVVGPLGDMEPSPAKQVVCDQLRGILQHLAKVGPSIEFLQVQLLLATSDGKNDPQTALKHLVEVYYEAHEHADVAIRAEALAHCLATVCKLKRHCSNWTDSEGLESILLCDVTESVNTLLNCTGDHEEIMLPIIRALRGDNWKTSLALIQSANTLPRRDALRTELVKLLSNANYLTDQANAAMEVISSCERSSATAQCCHTWWRYLRRTKGGSHQDNIGLRKILDTTINLRHASNRARSTGLAFKFYGAQPEKADVLPELERVILSSLDKISDAFDCLELSLAIASDVSGASQSLGTKCLDIANKVRETQLGGRAIAREVGLAPIRLALAAFGGLLPSQSHNKSDSDRLCRLIDNIPSPVARCELWSVLAGWHYVAGKLNECRAIVTNYIVKELQQLEAAGDCNLASCIIAAADGMFAAQPSMAGLFFGKLDPEELDQAIDRAWRIVIYKLPQSEPRRTDSAKTPPLKQEEVIDLEVLVKLAKSDSLAYRIVEHIADAVAGPSKNHWTDVQRSALANRLKDYGNRTLPRREWITHTGFLVLWSACCERIRTCKPLKSHDSGESYISKVPNDSDRCYMGTVISEWMVREPGLRVLQAAAEAARAIPVATERIERLAESATTAMRMDTSVGKSLTVEVLKMAGGCDRGDMEGVQRRVLDSAYRTNRDTAGAIAELLDNDPVRAGEKHRLESGFARRRLDEMESRRKIIDGEHETVDPESWERMPQACWDSLAGLNGGLREPKRIEDLRSYVVAAAGMPLSRAYPVLAWVIGNARVAYERTPHAARFLRPLFEAAALGAEFAANATFPVYPVHMSGEPSVVDAGDLDVAKDILREWLKECCRSELVIVDPFFGPEDLWALHLVNQICPDVSVRILSGVREGVVSDDYHRAWRRLSEEDPPRVEVIYAAIGDLKKCPWHDRWWFSSGNGLTIGTSMNGLGMRTSQMNRLSESAAMDARQAIAPHERQSMRKTPDGQVVRYSGFRM